VPQLNWAEELHARVGIATGLVVVDAALYFGAVAVRTAGYVTRMPGGVGGGAPRGAPLSRSSAQFGLRTKTYSTFRTDMA